MKNIFMLDKIYSYKIRHKYSLLQRTYFYNIYVIIINNFAKA